MVSAVLTVARHRCLVVLLTDLNPAVIEEGLLPRLGPLVSRNMVMIAAVADPRVAEMAAARGDAARLYDAAAAEGAQAERRRISALLRRHGVSVVDAPPDRLPSALADAYLELKASGRLVFFPAEALPPNGPSPACRGMAESAAAAADRGRYRARTPCRGWLPMAAARRPNTIT